MLMNSPHERAAGSTSGATRRKRVVERQRECAEIHGGSIKDPWARRSLGYIESGNTTAAFI
jgi:hypothetical protein